ncbi:MAG: lysophospholipid acyltransferase family protein [Pseudomonadota bacterium]
MIFLRNVAFTIVFYGLSVFVVLATPVAALFGHRPLARVVHLWAQLQRWCARYLLGIRVRIEGVQQPGAILYAAKHQAMFETIELMELLDEPVVVMKAELGAIPVWGWAARKYGSMLIAREGSAQTLRQMMRDGQRARASGRPVLLFPEGTRVPPGETPPLKAGFAGLYRALGLPVVPIALDSGRLWPRKGLKRPGIITLRFGEPIPAGLKRDEAEARVHAAINALERPPPNP